MFIPFTYIAILNVMNDDVGIPNIILNAVSVTFILDIDNYIFDFLKGKYNYEEKEKLVVKKNVQF